MNNKGKFWTARYALINATYFMAFCGVHAYASVFLLGRGFSNSQIGLMLALANVTSVIIQPIIAGWIDKPGKLNNRNVTAACTVIMIVFSVMLAFLQNQKTIIFVIYLMIYMLQMAYQPIMIAMNFEYAEAGCNINFGLARGLGSAGFAVYSPVLGTLLENADVSIIHIGDTLALAVGLLIILTFRLPKKEKADAGGIGCNKESSIESDREDNTNNPADLNGNLTAHNNVFDFIKHYPQFMLFLMAVIFFFFVHNMINDYLIQIITPLGGTKKHVGYATSMAAILELPTMMMFARLLKKIDCGNLLRISVVFFTVKAALMLFAVNITGVFISQFFQMIAYALFIPASAYYVNKIMGQFDQVKGQAYLNCAITLSGVLSGLIGGRILDMSGPKTMLAVGTGFSLAGTILAFFIVRRVENFDEKM